MSSRISGNVDYGSERDHHQNLSKEIMLKFWQLTVEKTASKAFPIASVTFAFRSFNLSIIGGTTISRNLAKLPIKPFARASIQFAAAITQLMFASVMRPARAFATSLSSCASLIRGVALRRASKSSRASFRSFHFEDARAAWRPEGSFGTMSTSSAKDRGSSSAGSVEFLRY